jgi:type IV pilus assembly protein PilA
MVVVAIVGILVAVAIPQYQKYQAKARQTEAKITLGAIYTAETSYSVENTSFTMCVQDIGANTNGQSIFYTAGFGTLADPKKCGTDNASNCAATGPTGAIACVNGINTQLANAKSNKGGATAVASDIAGAAIDMNTFTAGAAGQISTSITTMDKWTINQQKALSNTVVGI